MCPDLLRSTTPHLRLVRALDQADPDIRSHPQDAGGTAVDPTPLRPGDATLGLEAELQRLTDYLSSTERMAPRSVETYVRHCRTIFRGLEQLRQDDSRLPVPLGVDELREFMHAEEQRGLSASTRRTMLFALTAYYRYQKHLGQPSESPVKDIRPPRPLAAERDFYDDSQAARIIQLALGSDQPADLVGGVLMATLNYTGLRLSELITLRCDQLDLQRRRLRVVGKGSKVRTIPIPVPLVSVLQEYLEQLRPASSSPYVFVNPRSLSDGGNRGRFGQKAVARLVERLGTAAGVPGRHHPHRWRHTYATRLLRQGTDIHLIQRLLGHADISTSAGYLHLVHDDLQAAVDRSWQ